VSMTMVFPLSDFPMASSFADILFFIFSIILHSLFPILF
jgi:hypothetical protein